MGLQGFALERREFEPSGEPVNLTTAGIPEEDRKSSLELPREVIARCTYINQMAHVKEQEDIPHLTSLVWLLLFQAGLVAVRRFAA